VVLGVVVAAAAIAGSLSLNRNWGRVSIFIGRVPKQKMGRLFTFFHKREGPRHRKAEERRVL